MTLTEVVENISEVMRIVSRENGMRSKMTVHVLDWVFVGTVHPELDAWLCSLPGVPRHLHGLGYRSHKQRIIDWVNLSGPDFRAFGKEEIKSAMEVK